MITFGGVFVESLERAMLYAIPNFFGILLLIILMFSRKNTSLKTPEKTNFDCTLISIVVLLFTGSMMWFCECSDSNFSTFINYIMAFCYNSVMPIIGMFYAFYCECRMSEDAQVPKVKRTIFIVPVATNIFLAALSFFSRSYYDFSGSTYKRGPLFFIPFIILFAYLIYTAISSLSYAKKQINLTKKPEFYTLASFSILPIVSGLGQMATYGFEIFAISMAVSSVIVYNDIQSRLISTDPLTITNNQWQLNRYLERVGKNLSPQMMLFVFFIDIDNFRSISRSYGREVGNEALIEAATRLKKICSGTHDFLGRIGVDKFVIVGQRPTEPAADITRSVIMQKFNELGKQDFRAYDLNISIGVAGAQEINDVYDVDELIYAAEEDMKKSRTVKRRFSNRLG